LEFQNEFDVKAPIDQVWETLLDLEKVAPAMPGAQVLEKVDDDNYKVAIKVKVGPMSMQYRGDVQIADKDPEAHRATLKVKAREARGQGNANADVVMQLDESGEATHGQMNANVQLAGRAAAMGGSVIKDVSSKLVDQFARNLGEMLAGAPAEVAASNGGSAAEKPEAAPSAAQPQRPAPEDQGSDEEEGVDALGIAASVAADRMRDPRVLFGTLAIVLLIGWLLGRRSA
jgi:carbon monoxide dehydrogenase subunit G